MHRQSRRSAEFRRIENDSLDLAPGGDCRFPFSGGSLTVHEEVTFGEVQPHGCQLDPSLIALRLSLDKIASLRKVL